MPQLKKPIDSIEQMVCEHCIHFQQTPKCGELYCINPDSDDWDRRKDETCSKGTWLYFGKWIDCDVSDALHTMDYADVYLRLAEIATTSSADSSPTAQPMPPTHSYRRV